MEAHNKTEINSGDAVESLESISPQERMAAFAANFTRMAALVGVISSASSAFAEQAPETVGAPVAQAAESMLSSDKVEYLKNFAACAELANQAAVESWSISLTQLEEDSEELITKDSESYNRTTQGPYDAEWDAARAVQAGINAEYQVTAESMQSMEGLLRSTEKACEYSAQALEYATDDVALGRVTGEGITVDTATVQQALDQINLLQTELDSIRDIAQ